MRSAERPNQSLRRQASAAEGDNPLQISGTTQVVPVPTGPSVCALPSVPSRLSTSLLLFSSALSHLCLSHRFFRSVAALAGAGSRAPGIGIRLSLKAGSGGTGASRRLSLLVSSVTLVTLRLEGTLSQYRGAALCEIMVRRTHLRWKF